MYLNIFGNFSFDILFRCKYNTFLLHFIIFFQKNAQMKQIIMFRLHFLSVI